MRVYDGELCECGCSLMETQSGLYCPECGKIVVEWEAIISNWQLDIGNFKS